MRKIIFTVTIITLSILAVFMYRFFNLYGVAEPETLWDTDSSNLVSLDNRIYLSSRQFKYSVAITKNGVPQNLYIFNNLKNFMQGKNSIDYIVTEKKLSYPYCLVDNLVLTVFRTNGYMGSFGNQQTIIKYDYCSGEKRIFLAEKTGVVEDSTQVFLHPPRLYYFKLNFFNPYPVIKRPIQIGADWQYNFYVPEQIGSASNGISDFNVNLKYRIESIDSIKISMGKFSCYKINSTGRNSQVETSSQFYFNDEFGFVKIVNNTIDSMTTILQLEAVSK